MNFSLSLSRLRDINSSEILFLVGSPHSNDQHPRQNNESCPCHTFPRLHSLCSIPLVIDGCQTDAGAKLSSIAIQLCRIQTLGYLLFHRRLSCVAASTAGADDLARSGQDSQIAHSGRQTVPARTSTVSLTVRMPACHGASTRCRGSWIEAIDDGRAMQTDESSSINTIEREKACFAQATIH